MEFKLTQSLQHQQQNVGFSYLFKVYKPTYFDILYTIIWLDAFCYLQPTFGPWHTGWESLFHCVWFFCEMAWIISGVSCKMNHFIDLCLTVSRLWWATHHFNLDLKSLASFWTQREESTVWISWYTNDMSDAAKLLMSGRSQILNALFHGTQPCCFHKGLIVGFDAVASRNAQFVRLSPVLVKSAREQRHCSRIPFPVLGVNRTLRPLWWEVSRKSSLPLFVFNGSLIAFLLC